MSLFSLIEKDEANRAFKTVALEDRLNLHAIFTFGTDALDVAAEVGGLGLLPLSEEDFIERVKVANMETIELDLVESSYSTSRVFTNGSRINFTSTSRGLISCIAISIGGMGLTDRRIGYIGSIPQMSCASWSPVVIPTSKLEITEPLKMPVTTHITHTMTDVATASTSSVKTGAPIWASLKPGVASVSITGTTTEHFPVYGFDTYTSKTFKDGPPPETINWYPDEGDYKRGDLQINEPEGRGYHNLEFWVCVHTESPKNRTDPAWAKVHTVTASDLAGAARPEDIQNFITKKAIEVLEVHPR